MDIQGRLREMHLDGKDIDQIWMSLPALRGLFVKQSTNQKAIQ